jgi:hypothetical protein
MPGIPIRAQRGALAAILIASALHASAQQTAASGSIGISLCAISGADRRSTDLPRSTPGMPRWFKIEANYKF